MGKIFYIMGKSASGKDNLFHLLETDERLDLDKLVIYTTRPIREGEMDGREYHFIDEARLADLRERKLIIEERTYQTVAGPWTYATVADDKIVKHNRNCLTIGTLESYNKIKAFCGEDAIVPLFIEVDDYIRLNRALDREKNQENPNYAEVCRRFLADAEDFSEANIAAAGITRRFYNNGDLETCFHELEEAILNML